MKVQPLILTIEQAIYHPGRWAVESPEWTVVKSLRDAALGANVGDLLVNFVQVGPMEPREYAKDALEFISQAAMEHESVFEYFSERDGEEISGCMLDDDSEFLDALTKAFTEAIDRHDTVEYSRAYCSTNARVRVTEELLDKLQIPRPSEEEVAYDNVVYLSDDDRPRGAL